MRLVLFDIDGTLLKTNGAGTRALNRAFLEVFGLREGMKDVRPDGKTDAQIVREALGKNGGRSMPEAAALSAFFAVYQRYFEMEMETGSGLQVFWQAYHLVQSLRNLQAIKSGVATGNIRACAHRKLRKAGLHSFFAFGGFGCDAEERCEMVRTAVRRGEDLHGKAQDVVVIGDTPNDVQHGRRAGARTVGVATGRYSRSRLREAGADLDVDSLQPGRELMSFIQQA